jgi:hypothetical protein
LSCDLPGDVGLQLPTDGAGRDEGRAGHVDGRAEVTKVTSPGVREFGQRLACGAFPPLR